MAAHTRIKRDGEYRQLRWGWFHVSSLWEAMVEEVGEEALAYPRTFAGFPNDPYFFEFTKEHEFVDETDGEVFTILPGDRYEATG